VPPLAAVVVVVVVVWNVVVTEEVEILEVEIVGLVVGLVELELDDPPVIPNQARS
jgi:hypothetical protein